MSRKEAVNTFTDGMVKDLNPINTPNTVLTDCLNGTIITYDGNEYSLQNEKGNFPLKNCKLPANYIPVGVEEYGDILYIVSYNPITHKTQIGSYPSPLNVISASDVGGLQITFNEPSISSETCYNTVIANCKMLTFYGSNDPNQVKLNPNDEYNLHIPTPGDYWDYNFYILDENRNVYDITDKIEVNDSGINTFHKVSWGVPGWITIKQRFASIDDFKINVRSAVVPQYKDNYTITLNFQIYTSDNLIYNKSGFPLGIKYTTDGESWETVTVDKKVDLSNGSYVYSKNIDISGTRSSNDDSILTITAIPYLIYNNTNTKKVTYCDKEKSITFNLSKVANGEDLKIGNSLWQYHTTPNSMWVKFNTDGLNNSSVLSEDVYLYYTIQTITGNSLSWLESVNGFFSSGNTTYHSASADWNMLGETTLEFDLEQYTSGYSTAPHQFCAENIYLITFVFQKGATYSSSNSANVRAPIKKIIVASELLNGFKDSLYDTITFDRWMSKFNNSVQNKTISLNGIEWSVETTVDDHLTISDNYEIWKNGSPQLKNYNKLITAVDEKKYKILNGFSAYINASKMIEASVTPNIQFLKGPLWHSLLYNTILSLSITDDKGNISETVMNSGSRLYIDPYTGFIKSTVREVPISTEAVLKKWEDFTVNKISASYYAWNHEEKDLKVSGENGFSYIGRININYDSDNTTSKDGYYYTSVKYSSLPRTITKSQFGTTITGSDESKDHITRADLESEILTDLKGLKYDVGFMTCDGYYLHDVNGTTTGSSSGPGGAMIYKGEIVGDKALAWTNTGSLYHNNVITATGYGTVLGTVNGKERHFANPVYLAIINLNGNLLYIKTSSYAALTVLCNKIEKIESDVLSETNGAFYTADGSGVQTSSDFLLKFNGKCIFGIWALGSINMLGNRRESLNEIDSVKISDNFSLSKTSENNYIRMETIPFVERIAKTSPADEGQSISFGEGIDTAFEALEEEVSDINIEVQSQFNNLMHDSICMSNRASAYLSEYRFKDNEAITNQEFLDILNGTETSKSKLTFTLRDGGHGHYWDFEYNMGNIADDITIETTPGQ